MGSIFDAAKVTYAAGPSTDPTEPNKANVIGLFQLVESIIGTAIEGLIIGNAVVYATRSALYGDLAQPAGRLGIVYGDSNAALNGVYVKSGASGSGSWSLTNLVLPSSFISDLSAVIAEVASARQGRGNLLANIASINRRAPSVLATIGGTANAITGSDPLSTADESNDPATSYILIPAATNTAAATLSVNGDTARPIRTFANAEVAAGDLVAGSYYLLISDGGRYRVFSGLGTAPVKPSDLDLKANLTAFQDLLEEVTAARNGRGSLDVRLDTIDETVGGKASQTGLDTVSTEVANARQGRGSLLTNVAAISRRTPSLLENVAGTANAITATDALSTADESNDPGTCYVLVPLQTNTAFATLSINGDTARPIRTFSNGALVAGDLVAGFYYLLISDGTRFRVYSQLGTNAVRQSDVDSKASQAAVQALVDEVVAARNGRGTLDARLDSLDDTTAGINSEVTTARQGKTSLSAKLTDVSRRADNVLTDVAGTADAIVATVAGLSVDDVHADGSVFLLTPVLDNTGVVTLAINGDTARPVRTHSNSVLLAGDLVAGCSYRLRAEGTRYRVLSRLGSTPNRQPNLTDLLIGSPLSLMELTDNLAVVRAGVAHPISFENLATALELFMAGPQQYSYTVDPGKKAGIAPSTLIYDDPGIKSLNIQNKGEEGSILVSYQNIDPDLSRSDTLELKPGAYLEELKVASGSVKIAATQDNVPFYCRFWSTSPTNPNTLFEDEEIFANLFESRLSGSLTTAHRAALKPYYVSLYRAGILDALGGYYELKMHNSSATRINWAGPTNADAIGAPVFTAFGGVSFSAGNYYNTNLLISSKSKLDDQIMGVQTDMTIQGTNKFAIGDFKTKVGPNRTTGASTMASNGVENVAVTVGGTGGLQAARRTAMDKYQGYRNGTWVDVIDGADEISSGVVHIGQTNTTGGGGLGYVGSVHRAFFGASLTNNQMATLLAATQAYDAAVAGF